MAEKDSVNLIPISEIAAKDDFQAIKGQTRDDQLAAHRVPPPPFTAAHEAAVKGGGGGAIG